jgi:YesN/AraC family two-component response regulator
MAEKTKIFIVEDEVIHLEAAKICIGECGYETVGNSDSPDDAIRQIINKKADVVLVDINLNGKRQGIELAGKIIKEFQIPVIFTTCYDDCKTIEEAIETEPISYIVKPIKASNLMAAVMLALKKKRTDNNPSLEVLERILEKSVFNYNLNSTEKDFLLLLTNNVIKNIGNNKLDVEFLADKLAISRTGLYRKINQICGMSPGKLIRTIRLEKATIFFEQGECSVSQCAYNTGFENLSYFTKCFRQYFGVLPSEYRDNYVKNSQSNIKN